MSPQARRTIVGRLAQTLFLWFERRQMWLVVADFVLLGVSLIDPVRMVPGALGDARRRLLRLGVAGMFVITLAILRGWKVRLFILSPDFVRTSPSLDPAWADQARHYADQIEARIPEAAAELGVELQLVRYRVVPALHGFILGSGELFISFSWWDTKKGVLSGPRQFYDHFGPEDQSERAQQFRALFGNWLRYLDSVGEPGT